MADTPKTPAGSGKPAAGTPGPVESASAAPGEKRSAARPRLARASESGDPEVHRLLAERQTAQMNLAAHRAAADESAEALKGHEEKVGAADRALADLGFE